MSRLLAAVIVAQLGAAFAAERDESDIRDFYFGEALYHANQGHYFEALQRLDTELAQHYGLDEPELGSLQFHIKDAEFSVGDFELYYRMHHRAGRAITAVLEGDVDESVRNEAAYRLAQIHFQKDQLEDAIRALDRIEGRIPEQMRDDIEFLRANIFFATERPADAAVVLRRLQGSDNLNGFAAYNYGIALLQDGQRQQAVAQLDRAGQVAGNDEATMAIRDKANLVLGTLLLEANEFADAQQYLDRVRLEGPLSNQALLRAGWASVSNENYERAIVPWNILVEREVTDGPVQEAMLALPYAYSQLNVHGRAALLYGEALDSFGAELERLDASIESIREGRFLDALVREEIRQNKDWVIRLRTLPETPETYYLIQLLATHDFQTALQNYLDLEDLRAKLVSWQTDFDAFDDIIGLRRQYYEPLLPEIDQTFRELDSRIRLREEQHRFLGQRLQSMLTAPRPEFLATVEERRIGQRLAEIEQQVSDSGNVVLQERIDRLQGVLTWTLQTEYHERLTTFDEHLREVRDAIDTMTEQYDAFVRVRQAAVHSYEGYEMPLNRLRTRVNQALSTVGLLMARQGRLLEVVAINELTVRRDRLEGYRDQASYALAYSYDRAAKAQASGAEQ